MTHTRRWLPAAVLAVGAVLATLGVKAQRSLALRVPLAEATPAEIEGLHSRNVTVSPAELKAAGVTTYLARSYERSGSAGDFVFSLYVGYYAQQTQGQTIHSPKNCLPGAGWEPLTSQPQQVATVAGTVTVNRYLIQNGKQQALVLYWYQGRGRVAWNEYRVKWDLLRDAAIRRRSDEALVRIVVPIRSSEAAALQTATAAAAAFVPALMRALPA
jgi:EpsI family protein